MPQPVTTNRFDRSFNDVDPESSRPFSNGHPDGVWIVSTIFVMMTLVFVLRALLAIMAATKKGAGPLDVSAIVSAVVALGLYLPPVLLLFKRKAAAAALIWILVALSFIGAVFGGYRIRLTGELPLMTILAIAVALACFVYIGLYVQSLVRDRLLT